MEKERFFKKIRNNLETGCWDWTACIRSKFGYGGMKYDGRLQDAHRISWQIHNGPIPEGMYVLHSCDRPICVNPDHLYLGSPRDNVMDAINKGRFVIFGKEMTQSKGRRIAEKALSDSQVEEIKRLSKRDMSNEAIGIVLGLNGKRVYDVRRFRKV